MSAKLVLSQAADLAILSCCSALALIDAMACLQSIVMNWQLIRNFGWAHLGWHSLQLVSQCRDSNLMSGTHLG